MNQFKSQLRPISPHLSVYQPQITSVLSIYHRITGISLVVFLFLTPIVFTLLEFHGSQWRPSSLAYFSSLYPFFYGIYGLFILVLAYHFLNGIRHLGWDFGKNPIFSFTLPGIHQSGILVLLALLSISIRFFFS